MNNKSNISETINKYKSVYQGFKPTYSPALNDKVYFNMASFKHLIFKNKHRRKNKVIYSRIVLIPLIRPVIRKCQDSTETRTRIETINNKSTQVIYRALEARVGKSGTRVKVVVKKSGKKGNYYFQSIMKYN